MSFAHPLVPGLSGSGRVFRAFALRTGLLAAALGVLLPALSSCSAPRRLPRLTVSSEPPGVDVFNGGTWLGKTPFSVEIPPQVLDLKGRKPGYFEIGRRRPFADDDSWSFTLAPKTGTVEFSFNLPPALVQVDDAVVESGSNRYQVTAVVPSGRRRLFAWVNGFAPLRVDLDVPPDGRTNGRHVFVPSAASGRLWLESRPSGATILWGGVRLGTTPFPLAGIPSGAPQLFTLSHDGFASQTKSLSFSPGETRRWTVELDPLPERPISLSGLPPGAMAVRADFSDWVRTADSQGRLSILVPSAGARIAFRHADFLEERVTVDAGPEVQGNRGDGASGRATPPGAGSFALPTFRRKPSFEPGRVILKGGAYTAIEAEGDRLLVVDAREGNVHSVSKEGSPVVAFRIAGLRSVAVGEGGLFGATADRVFAFRSGEEGAPLRRFLRLEEIRPLKASGSAGLAWAGIDDGVLFFLGGRGVRPDFSETVSRPFGLASRDGSLAWIDLAADRVWILPDGAEKGLRVDSSRGTFARPRGLAWDERGDLWVLDGEGPSLRRLTLLGESLESFALPLPRGEWSRLALFAGGWSTVKDGRELWLVSARADRAGAPTSTGRSSPPRGGTDSP